MSIFDYCVQVWQQLFGATYAGANADFIEGLSVLTVIAFLGCFIYGLFKIVKAIVRRCSP